MKHDDDLSPARGLLLGTMIGVVIWFGLYLLFRWVA